MSRVKQIEAKGKKILFTDYSGLKTTEELLVVLGETVKRAQTSTAKCLSLCNFKDASISNEFMNEVEFHRAREACRKCLHRELQWQATR